jgi:alpha-tubulin suppressor-like RCC1 family protein
MTNYSKVRRSEIFTAILILLLSSITLIMLSGCSGEKYGVSGKVTSGGLPLPGATVTISASSISSVTTDANGNYSFGNVSSGTYTLSVSFPGYVFSPPSRKVYLQGINATGFNFSRISQVSIAASTHTVYVKPDGSVLAWGNNTAGQLGNGTTDQSTVPVPVSTAGGLPSITAVAVGDNHTVALGIDGSVWAWGDNSSGQLGDGTTDQSTVPVPVSTAGGLPGITAIAAGGNHTVALGIDGSVWAWGDNSSGQLGDGTNTNRLSPVQVSNLSNVIAIAAGHDHTVTLKNDNTVWTCGNNSSGQLGDGTKTNRLSSVQVSSLTGLLAIAAGFDYTIVLRNDNTVWTCGNNSSGQLGDGTKTTRLSPVQVSSLSNVIAIAAGFDISGNEHSVALKDDGTVWAWGNNSNGQLGDGGTTPSNTRVEVSGLSGIIAIAAGYDCTVALKTDNTVWAWGSNINGQLGDGTTDEKHIPVQAQIP